MHRGGGLEGLAGRFVRHHLASQVPQLLIDRRQQFSGSVGRSRRHLPNRLRPFCHGGA